MRAVLVALLAASIFLETAQGLMCYTCDQATTSSECNRETNCTAINAKLTICKTIVLSPEVGFPFSGNEEVFRQCAESCQPTDPDSIGITRKILCCNLDLCNRNGIDAASDNPCSSASRVSAPLNFVVPTFSLLATVRATLLLLQ